MLMRWWLSFTIYMERRRRELLLSEQASFEYRAHEAHCGLVDADRNIAVLRRKLDALKRGRGMPR